MSTTRASRQTTAPPSYRALVMSLVGALAVWAAMLAWRPLTEGPETFVRPLLACALVLGVTGGVLRWVGTHPALVACVQTLVAAAALLQVTAGSPVPTPDGVTTTVEALRTAVDGATRFALPVPLDPSPVTPLFLAVGIGSILAADMFLTLRQVPMVSIPLMVVLLVPANLLQDVPWWLLALVGAGLLVLIRLDRAGAVAGWGRGTGADPGSILPTRLGTLGTSVGLGATALVGAVVAGTVVPVMDLGLTNTSGAGSGGQDEVRITNPLVDMRRNLTRGADVPLLTVFSRGHRPTYLATTVLADYNGSEWTSGDRNSTADQRADGHETPPAGVDPSVPRTERPMEVLAESTFSSRWLALPQHATLVEAEGDWRRDEDTQDYVAWEKDLSTAGLVWSATGTELQLDHLALDRAPSGRTSVPSAYSELPSSLPPEVEQITADVTAGATTPFRRARALQDWFRSEFTYSLERVEPVGNDELLAFLSESGREGYCEQFAGAMAVMARTLGIPSRVVVGFLSPDETSPGTWEFSAHDLHAWPELYFPDAGWVRFEPTPAARADSPPPYTLEDLPSADGPDGPTAPSPTATTAPSEEPTPEPEAASENPDAADVIDWRPLLWGVLVVLALATGVAAAATPALMRRRRRETRMRSGAAEDLWDELRDDVVDLGLNWPEGRSPREVGRVLGTAIGDASLARLVAAVEHDRYAPPGSGGHGVGTLAAPLTEDLERCSAALAVTVSKGSQRRARWWPRSVFTRPRAGQ